jgi:hypothetical protein
LETSFLGYLILASDFNFKGGKLKPQAANPSNHGYRISPAFGFLDSFVGIPGFLDLSTAYPLPYHREIPIVGPK